MVAEGPRLRNNLSWFQCLKSNGHELQKSNASVQLRIPGPLQRQMPLHARPDRALSGSNLGTAARSHRSADRSACAREIGFRRVIARRIVERSPRTCCASAPHPAAKTESAERSAFRARDRRACAPRFRRPTAASRRDFPARALWACARSRAEGQLARSPIFRKRATFTRSTLPKPCAIAASIE